MKTLTVILSIITSESLPEAAELKVGLEVGLVQMVVFDFQHYSAGYLLFHVDI